MQTELGATWRVRNSVRCGLPRPCCTNSSGATSPVCSVFETHRGKWTAIPIFQAFQGSESMSFSSSADCQTPAKPGRTKSNPWWVPGRLICRGGGRELKCGTLGVCHYAGRRLCVLHECHLLKFSEVSYEDKDRFEMEKEPGRVSF